MLFQLVLARSNAQDETFANAYLESEISRSKNAFSAITRLKELDENEFDKVENPRMPIPDEVRKLGRGSEPLVN